jgi:hypothetical protein
VEKWEEGADGHMERGGVGKRERRTGKNRERLVLDSCDDSGEDVG